MDNDTAFPRLVSLACHDLRTPLATVSGFAKTLARGGTLEVDGRELRVSPITDASRPVVLGEDLRDLGAAVAGIVIRNQGGSLTVEDAALRVTF